MNLVSIWVVGGYVWVMTGYLGWGNLAPYNGVINQSSGSSESLLSGILLITVSHWPELLAFCPCCGTQLLVHDWLKRANWNWTCRDGRCHQVVHLRVARAIEVGCRSCDHQKDLVKYSSSLLMRQAQSLSPTGRDQWGIKLGSSLGCYAWRCLCICWGCRMCWVHCVHSDHHDSLIISWCICCKADWEMPVCTYVRPWTWQFGCWLYCCLSLYSLCCWCLW